MSAHTFLNNRVTLYSGDCLATLRALPSDSIDSIVTDPPYALVSIVKRFGKAGAAAAKGNDAYSRASAGFMGKQWDTGETAFSVEFWAECLRVLKPGGHVAAFGASRAHHRLWAAIEDAGFEVRDSLLWLFDADPIIEAFWQSLSAVQRIEFVRVLDLVSGGGMGAWVYGSGFPKSLDVAKQIDKGAPVLEAAQQWQGWGTALKPAWEPICLARKPLTGTVAANVLEHGTGALNIDRCRVGNEPSPSAAMRSSGQVPSSCKPGECGSTIQNRITPERWAEARPGEALGRWPANILHDGSEEVVAGFPTDGDSGSAARFFYSAKADAHDRAGSKHPTVKPVDLMQWLCRLITPPGGVVLDPFAGSGSTGEAAFREGFLAILCEREEEYQADIARRMSLCLAGPDERSREAIKARGRADYDAGPLFGGDEAIRGGADRSTGNSPTKTNDRPDWAQGVMYE